MNEHSPDSKRDPSLITVAVIITGSMAVLPLVWILLERLLKIQAASGEELGVIAGAIFTAGGLIIALVSIYSMLNVQRIARTEVDRLIVQLQKSSGERLQTYLRAFDRFLSARDVVKMFGYDDMDATEAHIKRALEIDDDLIGARYWIGTCYYTLAGSQFVDLHKNNKIVPRSGRPLPASVLNANVFHAISWLLQAKLRSEGPRVETTARLAELYGMVGGFHNEMLSCVRAVVDAGSRAAFHGNCSRAFLASSCGQDQQKIDEISGLLGIELICTLESLTAEWESFKKELSFRGSTSQSPTFWVIPRPGQERNDDPRSPGEVRLFQNKGGSEIRASWVTLVQIPGQQERHSGIPAVIWSADGVPTDSPPLPAGDVLSQLIERFYIIGKSEYVGFPERNESL